MPHSDSAFIPEDIKTKPQFYAHVIDQLKSLLEGNIYWVSNLSQVSSLLYNSYLSSSLYGFTSPNQPKVNWVGFYLQQPSSSSSSSSSKTSNGDVQAPLLVGPYMGKPACISITPRKGKGVCSDAFLTGETVIVENVDEYPGHIACDGDTKSEIVLPLRIRLDGQDKIIGVLDLDSTALATFDQDDALGLQAVVDLLRDASDWSSWQR